jgi:hypothetical protein
MMWNTGGSETMKKFVGNHVLQNALRIIDFVEIVRRMELEKFVWVELLNLSIPFINLVGIK